MSDFDSSDLGQLRQLVGNRLLLVPGARAIIENNQQQVLLQLRSDFETWGLPGGSAEPGENIEEAIVREVEEECGIRMLAMRPFGFGSNPKLETHTFPNGHEVQGFVVGFYCTEYSGQPSVRDDESLDFKWFDHADLPDMLPNMRESLNAYRRFLDTGQFQLF